MGGLLEAAGARLALKLHGVGQQMGGLAAISPTAQIQIPPTAARQKAETAEIGDAPA